MTENYLRDTVGEKTLIQTSFENQETSIRSKDGAMIIL